MYSITQISEFNEEVYDALLVDAWVKIDTTNFPFANFPNDDLTTVVKRKAFFKKLLISNIGAGIGWIGYEDDKPIAMNVGIVKDNKLRVVMGMFGKGKNDSFAWTRELDYTRILSRFAQSLGCTQIQSVVVKDSSNDLDSKSLFLANISNVTESTDVKARKSDVEINIIEWDLLL